MRWIRTILRLAENNSSSREANGYDPGALSINPDRNRVMVTGDNPIRRQEDDALGRAVVARSFAQQILSLDATEGVVVGVLGAWGSGKTSFVNLARNEFEQAGVPILDFNPWMFSGAEQLVESFFVELAAQLKIHSGLAEVGKDLEDYGESFSGMAWLPLVGPWIERGRGAAKILSKILQRRKEGVGARRAKLEKALVKLEKPILVVLDDIDRLSSSEIRDVFKLVRLTASFPKIIYIVAFDRVRVEEALAEQGVPGRDYLEKILQVAVDLPAVPSQVFNRQIFSAVDGALANIENPGPFDQQVWPDVFMRTKPMWSRRRASVRRRLCSSRSRKVRVATATTASSKKARAEKSRCLPRLRGAGGGS
jgi:predicted KAP-like P-loop ATPase